MNVRLIWAKNFNPRVKKMLRDAQNCIDTQCVEKMTEFVPVGLPRYRNSGKLRDSVEIREAGKIIYTAPFARHDYYATVNHQNSGNPKAQRMWFEVMKAKYSTKIRQEVSRITKEHTR